MLLHALADLDAAVDGFAELVEHDQHGAAAHERVRLQKARGQIAAARVNAARCSSSHID